MSICKPCLSLATDGASATRVVVRGDGSVSKNSTRGAESDSGGFVVVDMAVQGVPSLSSSASTWMDQEAMTGGRRMYKPRESLRGSDAMFSESSPRTCRVRYRVRRYYCTYTHRESLLRPAPLTLPLYSTVQRVAGRSFNMLRIASRRSFRIVSSGATVPRARTTQVRHIQCTSCV